MLSAWARAQPPNWKSLCPKTALLIRSSYTVLCAQIHLKEMQGRSRIVNGGGLFPQSWIWSMTKFWIALGYSIQLEIWDVPLNIIMDR